MHAFQEQYRTVVNSKTPKEFFQNLPQLWIDILTVIPGMAFILSVIKQLIVVLIEPYPYVGATASAKRIAGVFGSIALLLRLGKYLTGPREPRLSFKKNVPMLFFTGLIVLMLISTCINYSVNPHAVTGAMYRSETLVGFLIYFVIYYFGSTFIQKQKTKSILLYTFLIAALIQNIFVLFMVYVLHDSTHELYDFRIKGFFSQFNHYGYYLMLVVIISYVLTVLEKNKALKLVAFISFLIGSAALVLNDTFGCFLAGIAAMLFSIFAISVIRGKINLPSIGMFVLFWAISFLINFWQPTVLSNLIQFSHDVSNVASGNTEAAHAGTGRFTLWKLTLGYIKEKPLFGYGLEGIGKRLLADAGFYSNDRPHNEYLQYAAFFGIPALIAYLGGLLAIFLSAWKKRRQMDAYSLAALCTAFGYLFSALFGNTMHYTAPYLFIFLGLSIGTSASKEPFS